MAAGQFYGRGMRGHTEDEELAVCVWVCAVLVSWRFVGECRGRHELAWGIEYVAAVFELADQ